MLPTSATPAASTAPRFSGGAIRRTVPHAPPAAPAADSVPAASAVPTTPGCCRMSLLRAGDRMVEGPTI